MIRRSSAPHNQRRGVLISSLRDEDLVTEVELIQCCHCQFTTAYRPGLEKKWGVCWRCNDWHCDKPSCTRVCVPIKLWLENMADGRAPDHVPIVVSVPADPPKE